MYCKFVWLALCLYLSSSAHGSNSSRNCLDAYLQDSALKALVRHRAQTGALYKAVLPRNLSGMEVSVVRLRSKTLWKLGANFSNIHIPTRTISVPHVRRMAIVYQNLGNWSSQYYRVPGYSLITSVVGFLVYDASNVRARGIRNISLSLMGKPISVYFANLTLHHDMISAAKCVAFRPNGAIYFSDMISPNVCNATDQGHFSIVVGLERKHKRWYLWVVGIVLGCGGLVLMGYFAVVLIRHWQTKEIQAMEKHADDGEIFCNRWIGNSKLPSATVTRTQPDLEN
ncbi:hypothetical protein SLE2022_087310 [Rubroshorea leprosula]